MNVLCRFKHEQRALLLWAAVLSTLFLVSTISLQAQNETPFNGTVVAISRHTITVRDDNGNYDLFVINRDTTKPAAINVGSEVQVTSTPTDEAGVRNATEITIVRPASAAQGGGPAPVVPPTVRNIERQIERAARKYQAGVRAGVALDPELILIGVQAQIGPFFNSNVYFRPNVEFAYGEVTSLFALNPEFVYRVPVTFSSGRWAPYFGIGPGFNFIHQSFSRTSGEKRIDFGEFHSDTGLNLLGGVRNRNGMFMEMKTSVYARPSPTLRLIIGYNF